MYIAAIEIPRGEELYFLSFLFFFLSKIYYKKFIEKQVELFDKTYSIRISVYRAKAPVGTRLIELSYKVLKKLIAAIKN